MEEGPIPSPLDTVQGIRADMHELLAHPDRHVGGVGNRAATAMFVRRAEDVGLTVVRSTFDCIEWEYGEVALEAGDERFHAHVGPYSLPCELTAELVAASSVDELETERVTGAVVLLHGAIAAGQVMPKNFTFYNPESHRRIVRALEEYTPAAVVAATGRDPGMVGSQYPFPLFEDGDLDIPNAYMKDVDGERLLAHVGRHVMLRIDSRRIPATAEHVIATLPGTGAGRIVVSAHIDSRKDSPGALDNASGVATILAAARLLVGYSGIASVEFVPFNGEDNYANPGEMIWVAENEGRFADIVLGINIDDLGMRGTTNHVSFYGCPPELEARVRAVMARHLRVEEGPQWFQGDHAILANFGSPAIAMASSGMSEFMAEYAHSERDTIDLVDYELVAAAAAFVSDLVTELGAADEPGDVG